MKTHVRQQLWLEVLDGTASFAAWAQAYPLGLAEIHEFETIFGRDLAVAELLELNDNEGIQWYCADTVAWVAYNWPIKPSEKWSCTRPTGQGHGRARNKRQIREAIEESKRLVTDPMINVEAEAAKEEAAREAYDAAQRGAGEAARPSVATAPQRSSQSAAPTFLADDAATPLGARVLPQMNTAPELGRAAIGANPARLHQRMSGAGRVGPPCISHCSSADTGSYDWS